jgi:hypothetical protein
MRRGAAMRIHLGKPPKIVDLKTEKKSSDEAYDI